MTVTEAAGSVKEEESSISGNVVPSSASKAELNQKLRAVEFEIDAVASAIQQLRSVENDGECGGVGEDGQEQGAVEAGSSNDSNLQHVLAADRLRSLKKTKAQLEKELSELCKDDASKNTEYEKVIFDLVKEERRPKRKVKEEDKKLQKSLGKRHKVVSFNDDVDFDAVLDAASAGFVETVSYLIIITVFSISYFEIMFLYNK